MECAWRGVPPAKDVYTVQYRVDLPGNAAADRVTVQELHLDRVGLLEHWLDPPVYGQLLTDFLFSPGPARDAFTRARAADTELRIRLSFGPNAADLQGHRWETLRDPHHPGRPLLSDRNIHFSRFLSSFDWRPVRLRPSTHLRALIVVANPAPHGAWAFAAVKVDAERARASDNLAGIATVELCSDPAADPPIRVTVERLVEALREGPDILYLVCHGLITKGGKSVVFLEDDAGKTAPVTSDRLVQELLDLEQRPRLIVLAACESAGPGDDENPLVALGPRLAEAGIGGVLAMHGRVFMQTVAEFMPTFFSELAKDGAIDRATAVARARLSDQQEAWRPVLFMRLKLGRIGANTGFGKWPAVANKIKSGKTTPIIGPGLLETLFEYRPWLARKWAAQHFFPFVPAKRDDLAAVAQYLASSQYPSFPHETMVGELALGVASQLATKPGDPTGPSGTLDELFARLRRRRFAGRDDPYAILARLPLPVFILAGPDPVFVAALREADKEPQIAVPPWRDGVKDPLAGAKNDDPTPTRPLVYCLFGAFDQPRSLLVTQDDYIDFLLSLHKSEVQTPALATVVEHLADSSLLFLGLQIDSWEFRTVFRFVMQKEAARSTQYPHFSAQVDPVEDAVLDAGKTREYFEEYFKGSRVDLCWSTVERFLTDLEHLRKRDKW